MLLYEDDTVLISESAEDLQVSLNAFEQYCTKWKLTVNIDKTKVVIFSKGRLSTKYNFHFQDVPLDIVKEYKYLGIFLSKSGPFFSTKKYIANQAKRATYSLINKVRNLSLPVDLQRELFEKKGKPILLYGCEIWGFGNIDVIEQVQLRFFKYLFNLKTTTPNRPFSHYLCACVYRSRGALFLDNRRDFTEMGQTVLKPLILSM